MPVDIIPVQLDVLPVPIRVVSEVQKKYLELESMNSNLLVPALKNEIEKMNEEEEIPPSLLKLVKEIQNVKKLQLDFLKFVKEMTADTQITFEQVAADAIKKLVEDRPNIRKRLGEEVARKYLEERSTVVEVDE